MAPTAKEREQSTGCWPQIHLLCKTKKEPKQFWQICNKSKSLEKSRKRHNVRVCAGVFRPEEMRLKRKEVTEEGKEVLGSHWWALNCVENWMNSSLKDYCVFSLYWENSHINTLFSLQTQSHIQWWLGFWKCSDGKMESIASTSPSHTTLAYAAHCLPLLAKIEELAQRKINRWLNSNGLCHWTFYQWESNSRAVSEFQFSFRLRYVPAFYSLHLYAS